jgi:hypothetical protein
VTAGAVSWIGRAALNATNSEGGQLVPRGKPIVFEGVTYPSRRALARHLAPRTGRPYTTVATALVIYHDDVAAVLALYDRLNVKLENETFASQHAFCQALHRRHGVPQGTLRYWAKHFSPAEVVAKAEIGPRQYVRRS